VLGKLANSRSVLLRGARESSDDDRRSALSAAAEHIERMATSLREDTPLDSVRGCEGDCSRAYFAAFDRLLLPIDGAFRFQGRSRRPPLDPINAALSFAYSLLVNDVQAALETVGLDPQVGFLHRDRPGRSGLALDLAEEHRSWLADRLVLSLINRRQLTPDDFNLEPTGAVFLKEDARKTVIRGWAQRKLEEIQHPFLREKMPIGLMLHMQARLLAKHVRGDLDGYPPFLWK
jgi:CRISPR-associated protein Cas1